MNKIFEDLPFGVHFVDELGTRYIKLNLNSSHHRNPTWAWYDNEIKQRRYFNCIDYNGGMFLIPFDLPVIEIPNPNKIPLTAEFSWTSTEATDAAINRPEKTKVGLDILQSNGIITPDSNNS